MPDFATQEPFGGTVRGMLVLRGKLIIDGLVFDFNFPKQCLIIVIE
jgi:hypothetical protein